MNTNIQRNVSLAYRVVDKDTQQALSGFVYTEASALNTLVREITRGYDAYVEVVALSMCGVRNYALLV